MRDQAEPWPVESAAHDALLAGQILGEWDALPKTRIRGFDFSGTSTAQPLPFVAETAVRTSADSCSDLASDLVGFLSEDPLSNPGGVAQYALTLQALSPPRTDPQASAGGLNLGSLIRNMPAYPYAASNPVNYFDPTGLYCCTQSYGDCYGECLKAGDPLSGWKKAPLFLGMTVPGKPPYLGSPPITTLPSIGVHYGILPHVARTVGRVVSPAWVAYGTFMFGIEIYCAAACAADRCMFMY